jgi:hypothetical protein
LDLTASGQLAINGPTTNEALMSLPQTVTDVLKNHVTLEVEGIDRMYLNVYVPRLQTDVGVASFWRFHRRHRFASSVLMDPMSKKFLGKLESYAQEHAVPIVPFAKHERKDDVAKEHLAKFQPEEGVVLIGKAQEKARVFRTERRQSSNGGTYPWIVSSTALINQWYVYIKDEDFGPFFLKFSSYFPYNAKLCLNGHEYLKCQLRKAGVPFKALDNGIAQCADPEKVQTLAQGLTPEKIDRLLRKWLARLPHPFSAKDRAAGYRYQLSILQAEFSLTQVLRQPVAGRVFFEEIIRENLDLGRPDQVQLIFGRSVTRRTPGRFRTRVLTTGVIPSLHVDYKHSRIKQYHKEGQALRTETTINDTRDFGVGKSLKNLPLLRTIGFSANRRLLDVQKITQDCSLGEAAFRQVTQPVEVHKQRAAGLRYADPRVQAVLSAVLGFMLLARGFTNRQLRERVAGLVGQSPESLTAGRMSYDLRRLRLHGLIVRVKKSNRYHLTERGIQVALFFTRSYARILRPGLAQITGPQWEDCSPVRRSFDQLIRHIDQFVDDAKLVA